MTASPRRGILAVLLVATLIAGGGCAGATTDPEEALYRDVDLDTVTPLPAGVEAGRDFLGNATLVDAAGADIVLGWINDPAVNPEGDIAVTAAARFINEELGGVAGRKLRIEACLDTARHDACAQKLANLGVDVALTGKIEHSQRRNLNAIPILPTYPSSVEEYQDERSYLYSLGELGSLRVGYAWVKSQYPDSEVLVIYTKNGGGEIIVDEWNAENVTPVGVVAREDNTSVLAEAVERSRPDVVLTVADEFACVGLARALTEMSYQPRAVVSSSTCTARYVHDKLGDWPPEWFYIAGGPDLETYDSNPHAQLYRDRIRRYGGENADWTYRAALAFAAVMNASRILTHGEEAGDFNGYTGPIFMGVESYHCGKLPDWPGFCQHQARIMRYLSQRGWENVTENGPLTLP